MRTCLSLICMLLLITCPVHASLRMYNPIPFQTYREPLINYTKPLGLLLATYHIPKGKINIRITKSTYRLYILYKSQVVKSYPVVLGFTPVADKLQQGDGCTPEGVFTIRAMYPHHWWSEFIWLDYPNAASYRKIKEAKQKGLVPVNAPVGGDVGIHGVPAGMDHIIGEHLNWTHGCISLTTADINEIFSNINTSTTITIQK